MGDDLFQLMIVLGIRTMTPISVRLQELREARVWSQRELARRASITHATVNRIENAKVKSLDLEVLEKLATALEVDAGYLIVQTGRRRTR